MPKLAELLERLRRLHRVGDREREEFLRCLDDYLGIRPGTTARWELGRATPKTEQLLALEALASSTRTAADPRGGRNLTFIDLFAGIGGLRRAFESEDIGGRCVFTSEYDRYCRTTYYENYGRDHLIRGDIRLIPSEAIPEHDVLLAGFPCQPFSLAGVSKKNSLGRPHGFSCETQGTLFHEIRRIIEHCQPKAFLLENVKHLLRHDGGKTWAVIHEVLRHKLGYRVFFKVLDAASVLPQHRERIFLIGFRPDLANVPDCDDEHEAAAFWQDLVLGRSEPAAPTLKSVLHPEDPRLEDPRAFDPEERFLDRDGSVKKKYVLSRHLWNYLQNYADKHRARGNGFGFGVVRPDSISRTLSARYHKDGSEILVYRGRRLPRRLTPRECARLMGFDPALEEGIPANGLFRIPSEVSDTQAYRQFGNAVAVPVVHAVARLMRPYVLDEVAESDVVRRRNRVTLLRKLQPRVLRTEQQDLFAEAG